MSIIEVDDSTKINTFTPEPNEFAIQAAVPDEKYYPLLEKYISGQSSWKGDVSHLDECMRNFISAIADLDESVNKNIFDGIIT